ncbi:hypothetical protein, partial [Nocardioides sp.]|uniref:hypothetical protein n=1 Tax=Nocardioides sp. TaxID=35761 RepID=UPI00321B9355
MTSGSWGCRVGPDRLLRGGVVGVAPALLVLGVFFVVGVAPARVVDRVSPSRISLRSTAARCLRHPLT